MKPQSASEKPRSATAVVIGSVSSTAAALRGMLAGQLPVTAVLGLHHRHADTVSDFCFLGDLASQAGAAFVEFDKLTDPTVNDVLSRLRPDWLFVIGLSQLIPESLRQYARLGSIGFHPTPLPQGRGRAPVAWTILLEQPAAANLFFLCDEPDAGDIIAQRPVPVLPGDYAEDLIARTNEVLEQMVCDLCPALRSGQVPRTPQDHSRASYYPRRRPEDGLIDWNQPARVVHRLVRAVSRPYPGAFTWQAGRKLIVWRAELTSRSADGFAPGTVVGLQTGQPLVAASDCLLLLTQVEWVDMQAGSTENLVVGERFSAHG